jgi:hypothetical protein
LEDKLETRLQLFLKDQVEGSHNNLHLQMRRHLHNLCSEMGLDYPEIVPGDAMFGPGSGAESAGVGGPGSFRYSHDSSAVDAEAARSRESYRIRLLEARKYVCLSFLPCPLV